MHILWLQDMRMCVGRMYMIKMHLKVNFQEASMIEMGLMELIKVVKEKHDPSPEHMAILKQLLLEVSKTTTKLYELREEDDE
jgi:hypothetical protein